MKLAQKIAIRRSIQARKAAPVDAVAVTVETVKKPRSEKQLASDARFGEMVRARIAAAQAAKAETAEPMAA
jgi:hypothetical protein